MPDLSQSPLTPKPVTQTQSTDASKGMTLFVMIVATLYFGKEVLVPVTLALLLAFILAPLVGLLRRIHLGRVPSVLLGVALALGIISAIGGVIGTQISELSDDIPQYATTVEAKIASVKHFTIGRLSELADNIGRHTDGASNSRSSAASHANAVAPPQATLMAAKPLGSSPLDLAERYLSPILSPLATLGIVFVVAVFALLQREDLRDRLIRLLGSNDLHRTTLAIDEAGRRLSRYFITQLSINSLFGVAVGIGLLIIGVPNPVLWALLSALLRFVPYVGSLISAILPAALAAAVEPGWSMALSTVSLYVVIETITGQILEPLVYGHSTGLSPFSVVVAAIFWSWLWGPIGLILSTPLTLCLVVMGRHMKRFQFLEIMLGDSPALTPVESFYQRILAGDADEAQDYAELLLKDMSLSNYYDQVALKGLQLAVSDAQRGALDHEQMAQIKDTTRLLIGGLENYVDKKAVAITSVNDPVYLAKQDANPSKNALPQDLTIPETKPPEIWQESSAILCIAGRGVLDEAAAAMLAQLLGKNGFGAHLVGYNDVAREAINSLDVSGVSMVCISFIDISGNPAHLRYLIQRLRQRLPQNIPILVGLWPVDDLKTKDAQTKTIIGADYFVSSLDEAVMACVERASALTNNVVASCT